MKKTVGVILGITVMVIGLFMCRAVTMAKSNHDIIHSGIYIGDIDVAGMTEQEAKEAVESYVDTLKDISLTLHAVDDNPVEVTTGELGITWKNPEIVEEAFSLGKEGNIVKRYKELADLEHQNLIYDIELAFDDKAIRSVLEEKCSPFDKEAKDASLRRENGAFVVEGGQTGEKVDVDASAAELNQFLQNGWNHQSAELDLVVTIDEPKGKTEDLERVKDVLGTFTTSYKTSGADRSANVANGCSLINGVTLLPGEEFSAYETVSPFSKENGYHLAGSYLNGMVVESLGGGICQVSTTLYNAVLLAELEVVERHNHSMEVSYVQPSADAAIAESAGKDFKFRNNLEYPIYIEGYTQDKQITFTIYGVETRDPSRSVSFESEILSETRADTEQIVADASQPVGFVKVQSAHTGRNAKLWKIVRENGEEVSREPVNQSSYKMVPRIATVGTATSDPVAANLIQAAIATNNIDYVKGVAASLKAGDMTLGGQLLPQIPAETEPVTADPETATVTGQ